MGPWFSHKLILILHRFVHLIRLCFIFLRIDACTWFIFSVSLLIVLHSMFLSDGKIVFYLLIILFRFSKFIFYSSVSVCSVLFGVVVLLFSEIGDSFWLDCSCLSVLGVSDIVILSCSLFAFWCISSISRWENQPIFIIVRTWSASLWLVV